jgi:hypothetical protein
MRLLDHWTSSVQGREEETFRKTCLLALLDLGMVLTSNCAWADSISVNPAGWTVNGGTMSQTLPASLLPDTTYTITISLGVDRPMNKPPVGYSIELLAGSSLLASMGSSSGFIAPGAFTNDIFSYWTLDGAQQALTVVLTDLGRN